MRRRVGSGKEEGKLFYVPRGLVGGASFEVVYFVASY